MILLYIGFMNAQYIMHIFLNILSVLLPFVLGFIVSYAINPFVVFLEKKIPHSLAVVLVIFLLLLFLSFLIFTIFPILYHQIVGFSIQLIQIINHFSEKFQFSSLKLEISLTHFFNQILQNIGTLTTSTTVQLFQSFFEGVSGVFIGSISFVYFLFYMNKIRSYFREVFLFKFPKLYRYLFTIDRNMVQYVKGVGILMLVQFLEYSLLFFVIGHPHWLVLGLFIGVFTAIPYVGGFVANGIALLTAFMISKSLFYSTLFVCLFFPLVDEYFISPKIYGKSNNIHPVITIFLLSVGGSVGGVLGIILAIPVYLFIRTTIYFFKEDTKKVVGSFRDVL